MYTKVKLLSLTDGYEHKLVSSTGKLKKEYIGQIGKVIHTCVISKGNYVKPTLYDVQFDDGAIFCLDEDQIKFVALGALEPELSISFKESMRELNRRFTDVDSVFSSLSLLIENRLYCGQNKH
jgi:hypothetical protein|nr:MAG TPA: hypothetical protein [Caudoviricetes sp.]